VPSTGHIMNNAMILKAARALACGSLSILAACGGAETHEIEDVRERRGPLGPAPKPVAAAERFGFRRTPPQRRPRRPATPAFKRPEGWTELPATSLRAVNLRADSRTECYLTVLPGAAGGLAANVNRWREQMGRAPLKPAEIDALPQHEFLGGEGALVDIAGTYSGMGGPERSDYRMLGLLRELDGRMAFLKMVGPAETVEREREHFLELAASLELTAPADPHHGSPHGSPQGSPHGAAGASQTSGDLTWSVPEGWTRLGARPMRAVTLAPEGATKTECYVTVLGGDAGGLVANVNRWRNQMGLAVLEEAAIRALPAVEILGREVPLVELEGPFRGMGGKSLEQAAMLALFCPLEAKTVTVKMIGPAEVVKREKERFLEFCRSLRRKS